MNDADEAMLRLTAWTRDCGASKGVFADDVIVLLAEVRRLRGVISGMADRIARQSELLSARAEKETNP